MTAERLAEIRERVRFLAEPGDRDPALIEHLRTTTAASAPKAVFDAQELLAEVERLREGIEQMAAADFYDWRIRGDAEARARSANLKALIYPEESA